jgi:hypothetical protein
MRKLKNIYIREKDFQLIEKVEELAEKEDRSFSQMLLILVKEALKARGMFEPGREKAKA